MAIVLSNTRGENSRTAKLTNDKVREIRKLLRDGKSVSSIAEKMGVAVPTIGHVKDGRTWSHITD